MINRVAIVVALLLFASPAFAQNCTLGSTNPGKCSISDYTVGGAIGDTDAISICQHVGGCHFNAPGVTYTQMPASGLVSYLATKVTPPLTFSGGLFGLAIDSTLSVVGGQLHVVGGGGGGLNQLTQDVLAGPGTGSQAATVVGLQTRPVSSTPPSSGQCLGWNGSTWLPVACGSGGGITQLTGPVTAGPGSGSVATTITPTGVTAGSYTLASCTGSSCTPASSCWTIAASGQITSINLSGACTVSPGGSLTGGGGGMTGGGGTLTGG